MISIKISGYIWNIMIMMRIFEIVMMTIFRISRSWGELQALAEENQLRLVLGPRARSSSPSSSPSLSSSSASLVLFLVLVSLVLFLHPFNCCKMAETNRPVYWTSTRQRVTGRKISILKLYMPINGHLAIRPICDKYWQVRYPWINSQRL